MTGHLEGLDSEKEEDPPRLLRFLISYHLAFFAELQVLDISSFRRFTEELLHIILFDSMIDMTLT